MRSFLAMLRSGARHRVVPGALLVLVSFLSLAGAGPVSAAGPGQWTPWVDWGAGDREKYAVHLALLPGDGTSYHSNVLFFHGEFGDSFSGRLWGWRTGNDGCQTFPGGSFVERGVPTSGLNPFCAGATAIDRRVLIIGGHDPVTGDYGERRCRIFDAGACGTPASWSEPGEMRRYRWYAVGTGLRDGRILATTGRTYPSFRLFGGQRNGALPTGTEADSLYDFVSVPNGRWDPAAIPEGNPNPASRPSAREGLSAAELTGAPGFRGQVFFGGATANGPLNDVWILSRTNNELGPDFQFTWNQESPSGLQIPDRRSEHSAVAIGADTSMVMFGGKDQFDFPLHDLWRLYWDGIAGHGLSWSKIDTVNAGPTARYGHAAFYDEFPGGTLKRMFVFGGTDGAGQPVADATLWELRFDQGSMNQATWRAVPMADSVRPAFRFGHRMSADPTPRNDTDKKKLGAHGAVLFGGDLGGGVFSDTLWVLWLYTDGTARWERKSAGGTSPGGRVRFNQGYDPGHGHGAPGGRLYTCGGETTAPADRYVYTVDPWVASPSWSQWAEAGATLAGAAMLPDYGGDLARPAEIYDPVAGTWQSQPQALLAQEFYAPTFLVPEAGSGASRVISLGYQNTYWLDVPYSGTAGAWQKLPNGGLGFVPQSGVNYRPGRLMVVGGAGLKDSTKVLDASSTSHAWVDAGHIVPRYDFNLVLLPTGQALAVGGVGTAAEDSMSIRAGAVRHPQLWTPPEGDPGGVGFWSEPTALDSQYAVRDDHSTAILLPDGRVLSAGGEFTSDRRMAEIYCPPYLFKSDGVTLAQRPTILAAPPAAGWGESLMVSVTDTTGIRAVCLIRPGVVTHGFDQNQRFVPLSFTALGSPARLSIITPATPDEAPPGYYLLFVVGSSEGAEVPSIARWIRLVDRGWGSGPDARSPGTLTDFTPDAVAQTSAYFTWSATADDSGSTASGPTREYELRMASQPIDSEARWEAASGFCGEPVPEVEGTAQDYTATGLAACTWYDFALRTTDERLNRSLLQPDRVFLRTLCSGGGGGGYAARAAERDAAFRATTGALVAETDRAADGGWQLTLRALGSTEGLEGAATDGVSIQDRLTSGAWRTRSRFAPGAEEPALGLCALRDAGRAIVAGDFGLQQVAGAFTADRTTYALASAAHSSQGELDLGTVVAGGGVTLAVGDTLRLRYAAASALDSTAAGWYLLAGRGLLVTATRPRRAMEGAALPLRFALHPNAPNPFAARTTIRFDLPVGAIVRLEVFDIAGRRVALLANHYFPPGYQAVEWDRRTPSGLAAGAGVYFYRIEAGPWRVRQKMVLLP
jgi:hypothetical protein